VIKKIEKQKQGRPDSSGEGDSKAFQRASNWPQKQKKKIKEDSIETKEGCLKNLRVEKKDSVLVVMENFLAAEKRGQHHDRCLRIFLVRKVIRKTKSRGC